MSLKEKQILNAVSQMAKFRPIWSHWSGVAQKEALAGESRARKSYRVSLRAL
jgi:hypothetical protein